MNTANQMAEEIYGLHCDIGRLEKEKEHWHTEFINEQEYARWMEEQAEKIEAENSKLRELLCGDEAQRRIAGIGEGVTPTYHSTGSVDEARLVVENTELRERDVLRKWYARMLGEQTARVVNLQELVRDMWRFTGAACKKYPRLFDPAAQGGQTVQLNVIDAFEQRMRELGIEVD